MASNLRSRSIRKTESVRFDVGPPLKRRRVAEATSTTNDIRKTGILDLALEVLFEVPISCFCIIVFHYLPVQIFLSLSPIDLLHLARTTKAFRSTLMSRNVEFIWKACHSNVDIMELIACPPFLSEPHLADLAWERHCYKCGAQAEDPEIWLECLARYCDRCHRRMYVSRFVPHSLLILCARIRDLRYSRKLQMPHHAGLHRSEVYIGEFLSCLSGTGLYNSIMPSTSDLSF